MLSHWKPAAIPRIAYWHTPYSAEVSQGLEQVSEFWKNKKNQKLKSTWLTGSFTSHGPVGNGIYQAL